MEAPLYECGLCFNDSVFGFCENCSFRLCEKCFSNHKRVTLFIDHTLFPLNKSTQSAKISVVRENDIHEQKCTIHKTDVTSFYCEKDDELICGRCMHSDHRACLGDIIDLHNVRYDEYQTNELTNTLKQLEEEISGIDSRVNEHLKLNDECKETCMKEITAYIKKLHDRLDLFREKAVTEVNVNHIRNTNNIRVVANKCKEAKERIIKECDFIYGLSHKKHERHLFIVSKRLSKEVDEIKTIIRQSNLENNIAQFTFLTNKAVECTLLNDFIDIGKLQETCDGSEEVVEDLLETRSKQVAKVIQHRELEQKPADAKLEQATAILQGGAGRSQKKRELMTSEALTHQEWCVICLYEIKTPKTLMCGHIFCRDCIDKSLSHKLCCPICGRICGTVSYLGPHVGLLIGDQPPGKMTVSRLRSRLYNDHKICIKYEVLGGRPSEMYPTSGSLCEGITLTLHLPDKKEGQHICRMLKVAFERKLLFTLDQEGSIIWQPISLDNRHSYLDMVIEELTAKGVSVNDIDPTDELEGTFTSH